MKIGVRFASALWIPATLFIGGVARAQTPMTERISVSSSGAQGNDRSALPSVSADGRYVAFYSNATNVVAGDTNGCGDVFVRDRQTGTTERVSVSTGGMQGNAVSGYYAGSFAISANGRYLAFASSANNLVAGDTNGFEDIFVRDRQNGMTERVSVDSAGLEANSPSIYASISADGRFVVFTSGASNLVPGDTNGFSDYFVRDRSSGSTERVSIATNGAQGNDHSFGMAAISADGRFVAFDSHATNFVAGDTNGSGDVFVRDRFNATTELASLAAR